MNNKILDRKQVFGIDYVYNRFINNPNVKYMVNICNERVPMNCLKYKVFEKSADCSNCNLKGSFFALEHGDSSNFYHFNLYGIDEEDQEVRLSVDHIIPKSKGGTNDLDNLKTLCEKCNTKKSDFSIKVQNLGHKISIYMYSNEGQYIGVVSEVFEKQSSQGRLLSFLEEFKGKEDLTKYQIKVSVEQFYDVKEYEKESS